MTSQHELASLLSRRRISRRSFMEGAAAIGLGIGAASALADRVLAQTPKRGGTARFGLAQGATTDALEPGNYLDTGTQVPFWGAMSNSLTDVDAKGNIVGDVAESFEPNDDATQWVFKLRKGLTFHNGRDVVASDVVASFRHHMGPDSKSAAKSVTTTFKSSGARS